MNPANRAATTAEHHPPLSAEERARFWSTTIGPWTYDFDYLGHMTAAIYPKAFEEGRVRYFRDRWAVAMPAYVVAHHVMEYTKEILQEVTPIHVLIRPTAVGSASMRFEELILDSQFRVCNRSQVTLVAWNQEKRRSRALTASERKPLELDVARFAGA